MIPISDRTRKIEIFAAIATASGKFIFMDWLDWKFPFIMIAIAGWAIYIFIRNRTRPGILQYWGFRTDNFRKVMVMIAPFAISTIVACFVTGVVRGTLNLNWHIIPILVLYPVWGVIQQFLLIALTSGNLQDMEGQRVSKPVVILIAAFLFAIVHYPIGWLVSATFVIALYYGWLYMKERNLYVLGLFHGWLGGIFYYTVLGKDPFAEVFGKLLSLNK